jgi:hypothetical protein
MRSLTKNAPQLVSDKLTKSKDGKKTVFTSERTTPIRGINCYIPRNLLKVMRQIEKEMSKTDRSGVEFGLYLKGEMVDGYFQVKEEYMLPEQTVSSASIDFTDNDDGGSTFNGVIHRHPSGCKSFSATDDKHINANYMFSLLYVNQDIPKGIINIPTELGRIQIDMTIVIEEDPVDISHLNLGNIKKNVVVSTARPVIPGMSVPKSGQSPTVRPLNSFQGSMNNGMFSAYFEDDYDDVMGNLLADYPADDNDDDFLAECGITKSEYDRIVSCLKKDSDKKDFMNLTKNFGYEINESLDMLEAWDDIPRDLTDKLNLNRL